MLPAKIGRYDVLGELAAGGMAEILLARLSGPAQFKRAVVIKRILKVYATNTEFVRMFLDEARIVASLRHPNLVHVQELGEQDGEVFLVMEYVAGENAATFVKRVLAAGETLDPRLAAHLVADVCAGLHTAHELTDDEGKPQNLVHRDVSPQNILVGYDGHVKLVDFGVALVDRRETRTEPGDVKGKFEYMSPEQALGKPLDRRSDLFSLGIVLYELSTGRRLFKRASPGKTIEAITREPIVPPSRAVPPGAAYPQRLEAIVMKALSRDANARYATAAEMRLELLEIARELPSPVETLAEQMRKLFADRIAEKEELLRKVREDEGLSQVPSGETRAVDENVQVLAVPEAPQAAQTVVAVPTPRGAQTPARRSSRNILIAASASAVVLLATVGAVVFGRSGNRFDAAPTNPSTVVASASASAASSSEVLVHFETKPPGARVVIGGQDRGETPIGLSVARGAQPIGVELRRQGYLAATQQIIPDADQKVVVGLTPAPHGGGASRPTRPARGVTTSSAGFRRFD